MSLITDNIFWILIVSGALTCTMLLTAIAPQRGYKAFFGVDLPDDPTVRIVVCNWAAMITMTGILLIVAAFEESARLWVLSFAAFGKTVFAALVLADAARYRAAQAFLASIIDLTMVVLFVLYLYAA